MSLITFKIPGRKKLNAAIMTPENSPYPLFYVCVKEGGKKYLKKPNYIQRKRIHKYIKEHHLIKDKPGA